LGLLDREMAGLVGYVRGRVGRLGAVFNEGIAHGLKFLDGSVVDRRDAVVAISATWFPWIVTHSSSSRIVGSRLGFVPLSGIPFSGVNGLAGESFLFR
jgi:hypothetical protein